MQYTQHTDFIEFNIDSITHPDLPQIFEDSKKVFTLPGEYASDEEMLAALARNLGRNSDVAFQKKYGPCKEMWICLKTANGKLVGATNFDIFAGSSAKGIDGTLQGIFIFVNPSFQGQGIREKLFQLREEAAKNFIRETNADAPDHPTLLTFVEQHSPLLMTPEEYKQDSEASIDQIYRRNLYEKHGFKTINMRYIQPPMKQGDEPSNVLDLCVKGASKDSLPVSVVKEHLKRYFALSFPDDITFSHPTLVAMKKDLDDNLERNFVLFKPGKFTTFAKQAGILTTLGATIQLPETKRHTPLGKIFGAAAGQFYEPPKSIRKYKDVINNPPKHTREDPDVLIIGAGITGLKAAEKLNKADITYRILEATSEAGGRAKTVSTYSGIAIDTGAHWGHNSEENPLTKQLDKHGLSYSIDTVSNVISYRGGIAHGKTLRQLAGNNIDNEKAQRIINGLEPDCPLADLLKDEEARKNFCRKYSTWYGLDPNQHPSALEYLTDKANPGGFQLKGGIKTLIDAMGRDAKLDENTLFNTPVKKISSTSKGVQVETQAGEVFKGKRAIVTVPISVLKSGGIEFDPPLSQEIRDGFDEILVGQMTKIIVELDHKFFINKKIPVDQHLDLLDSNPPLFCHLHSGGKPTITMLIGGSKAIEIEKMSSLEALDFFHQNLKQVKEIEGYENYITAPPIITEWNSNPYALGVYTACAPGGKRTGPLHQDKIYIAGDTFDTEFPASMAGAFRSGKEVAAQVIQEAKSKKAWSVVKNDKLLRKRGNDGTEVRAI